MSPEATTALITGAVTVMVAAVTLLFAWLRGRLGLSDATAYAVSPNDAVRPANVDEAIRVLAFRIGELDATNDAARTHIPHVEAWGTRGWAHVAPQSREPMPPRPDAIKDWN